MDRIVIAIAAVAALAICAGICVFLVQDRDSPNGNDAPDAGPEVSAMDLVLTVDGKRIGVEWEDNPSVNAVKAFARDTLTVPMVRYGGFEQTGSMERSVVRNDTWTEVGPGDIVLYRGIQICLYFGDNAYDFTRLGRIVGMTESEIAEMLDRPSVTAVLTLE